MTALPVASLFVVFIIAAVGMVVLGEEKATC